MNNISYDPKGLMSYIISEKHLKVEQKECHSKWVKDEISLNDIVDTSKANNMIYKCRGPEPILISAPTGSGKSSFVFDVLVPDAKAIFNVRF